MKLLKVAVAVAAMAGLSGPGYAEPDGSSPPLASEQMRKQGQKSSLSVLWAGHSLMEQEASSSWGRVDLMSLVGRFAESRQLSYTMTDHTLFGSPLSALWRGKPHSYDRDASEMVAKREAFERDAGRYDTLVLTEVIPLSANVRSEFSAYYVRRFACTLWNANPEARVYLYQTWVHFQGSHHGGKPSADGFDWRAEMIAERAHWDELAETASRPDVPAPHWLSKVGWHQRSDGGCSARAPIYLAPVGSALLLLDERLKAPKSGDHFVWPDGAPFQLIDMASNPTIAPAGGLAQTEGARAARDPSRPADDIHASLTGIYFSALVHFATLYQQSPIGLPYPAEIGENLARTLACIAWQTVAGDARSGVAGEPVC